MKNIQMRFHLVIVSEKIAFSGLQCQNLKKNYKIKLLERALNYLQKNFHDVDS